MTAAAAPTAVGLVGHGAIGAAVAAALRRGDVAGHTLSGILTRAGGTRDAVDSLSELLARSDVVVEAAGHAALAAHGPATVAAGRTLVVVSAGALVDDDLRARLAGGPGAVRVPSGAVGGLDALRAAHLAGGLDSVRLTTTKPAATLVQPWMTAELQHRLRGNGPPIEVFEGPAAEAAQRFPRSLNVAATLALATLGLERTRVRLVGDPAATGNEHVIEASGTAGDYRFVLRNRPAPENPNTSRLTALSVLRLLEDRAAGFVVGA